MAQDITDKELVSDQCETVNSTAGKISFLAFPAEIRNLLYDILFRRPIHLTSDEVSDTPRAQVPGINLLATCRQINSEATGVLYTQNDFTVSAHSADCLKQGAHTCTDIHTWLSGIGRQRQLVRKVLIDLSTPCPSLPDYVPFSIHLTHIVRQSVLHGPTNPSISFVGSMVDSNGMAYDTPVLNMLLHRLSLQGSSHLDDCVRLAGCPCRIEARLDSTQIKFVFYDRARILFYKEDDGEFYMEDDWYIEDIEDLPEGIVAKIAGMIVGPEPTFELNINTHILSPPLPVILGVSRLIRRYATPCMDGAKIRVRCTIPNEVVDPKIFRDLKSWTETGGFTSLRDWYPVGEWPLPYRSSDIVLSTFPCTTSVIQQIRVDALELVFSTLILEGFSEVHFEHQNTASTQAVTTVSLNCLRHRVLHFLDKLNTMDYDSNNRPCPTLWMDEQCRITGAVFQCGTGSREFIENVHPDWTPPNTSNEHEVSYREKGYLIWLWDRKKANDSQLNPAEMAEQDEGVREARENLDSAHRFLQEIMSEIPFW